MSKKKKKANETCDAKGALHVEQTNQIVSTTPYNEGWVLSPNFQ